MNDPAADIVLPKSLGFNSRDCIDLILDGPGDTTVLPMRPELRERALAFRANVSLNGNKRQAKLHCPLNQLPDHQLLTKVRTRRNL